MSTSKEVFFAPHNMGLRRYFDKRVALKRFAPVINSFVKHAAETGRLLCGCEIKAKELPSSIHISEKIKELSRKVIIDKSALQVLTDVQARLLLSFDSFETAFQRHGIDELGAFQLVRLRIGDEIGVVLFAKGRFDPRNTNFIFYLASRWMELKDVDIGLSLLRGNALSGIAISSGLVIGRAYIHLREEINSIHEGRLADGDIESALKLFSDTLERAQGFIDRLRAAIKGEDSQTARKDKLQMLGKAEDFLQDPVFIEEIEKYVREKRFHPTKAIISVIDDTTAASRSSQDQILRDRVIEFDFFKRLLLCACLQLPEEEIFIPTFEKGENIIWIARKLDPGDAMQLRDGVVAVVTEQGARTDHGSLIVKALGIPGVVGAQNVDGTGIISYIRNGDTIVVDGDTGRVYIAPNHANLDAFNEAIEKRNRIPSSTEITVEHLDASLTTIDGRPIYTRANISFVGDLRDEISKARSLGATGVGLARVENLFHGPVDPRLQDLFFTFRLLLQGFYPDPVVVRLLDVVDLRYRNKVGPEANPNLGLRGVRFLISELGWEHFLIPTIQALILANEGLGNALMQIPMVNNVSQVLAVKAAMLKVAEGFNKKPKSYQLPPLGIMVETPEAAVAIETFRRHVDFFGIGTNDLTQYVTAADRDNHGVASLYNSFSPAMFWLLNGVINFAKEAQIPIGMCGDMASNYKAIVLLIGMGLDIFSVSPRFIPGMRNLIGLLNYKTCQSLVERIKEAYYSGRILGASDLEEFIGTQYPDQTVLDFLMSTS